jgi:hypothetical protein
MKGADDIDSYLLKLGIPFEQLRPEMWNVKAEHENLVISIAGPVLVFRVKVMDVPRTNREALFEALLRLNTTEMVHGAFGIEDQAVVIVHALALEDLDFSELQVVIEDLTLAIGKHYPALSRFRPHADQDGRPQVAAT